MIIKKSLITVGLVKAGLVSNLTGQGGGPVVPTKRMYYTLDQLDDYIGLAQDYVMDATPIEIDFIGGTVGTAIYARFLKGDGSYNVSVDTDITGDRFRLSGCTATLNGVEIVSGVTPVPASGLQKLVVNVLPAFYGEVLRRFGAAAVGGKPERYLGAVLTRIKVGSVINLAMDDGPVAGQVLLNTGSGGNAHGRNFNPTGWYEDVVL